MRRSILLALALAVTVPATARAQEADDGGTVVVSYWKCDYSHMGTLIQRYDSLSLPINQELVNEGMLRAAGMLTHDWADEWNVLYWWEADDKASFFEASQEGNRRFNERHPDPPTDPTFLEACWEHRDGIYDKGPRSAMSEQVPDTTTTTLVVSYWKCDFQGLDAMVQQYDSLSVPIQNELVDEGLLLQAGVDTHDWGDRWNLVYWWWAVDKPTFFREQEEENRRFSERHPNPPDPQFLDVCTDHRDAIYNAVSGTMPAPTMNN